MPGRPTPATQAFPATLTAMQAQLNAINAWIRTTFADSGWIEPGLLNGWKNEPAGRLTVAYRKIGNIVRLRGSLFGGASNTEAFQLPVGYRPTAQIIAPGSAFTAGANGAVACLASINATGNTVIIYPTGASQTALDGITFTTD